MTREEAVNILSHLINSGILDEKFEGKLKEIIDSLCKDKGAFCAINTGPFGGWNQNRVSLM